MSFFKYLAIGDSIAQGFNSKVSSKTNGFKIKKGGEFYSGYSYTDYFLEYIYYYIQKNERKIPELKNFWTNLEYKNIALAAARISDINKILNNKIDDDLRSIINFNKELSRVSNFYNVIFNNSSVWWAVFNNLKF